MVRRKEGKKERRDKKQTKEDKKGSLKRGESRKSKGLTFLGEKVLGTWVYFYSCNPKWNLSPVNWTRTQSFFTWCITQRGNQNHDYSKCNSRPPICIGMPKLGFKSYSLVSPFFSYFVIIGFHYLTNEMILESYLYKIDGAKPITTKVIKEVTQWQDKRWIGDGLH